MPHPHVIDPKAPHAPGADKICAVKDCENVCMKHQHKRGKPLPILKESAK